MKKVIRLTESDLTRIVKRVINENEEYLEKIKTLVDAEHFEAALQLAETLGLEEKVNDLILDKKINMVINNEDFSEFLMQTLPKMARLTDEDIYNLISNYIETNIDLKMILDRLDPNSRKDKHRKIHSIIFSKLLRKSSDLRYIRNGY